MSYFDLGLLLFIVAITWLLIALGGNDGATGRNCLYYANGKKVYLGGKASVSVGPGDVFHLETPGGGGYGSPTC